MKKEERQDLILKLIGTEPISRQDIIASKLARAGYSVTQASVSRDLDELGIRKVDGIYARVRPAGSVGLEIRSAQAAGDVLIVLKCDPGMASAMTVRIDGADLPEVIGTIAGDDTIFVAVGDAAAQKAAIAKITSLFEK
jgi:transcriptional regulator of arginine metabolism